MTGRLELQHVQAGYSGTIVLRGLNLVAPAGKVTALLGPNGAGKTTLLRTASGLLPPSEGTLLIDGRDVTHCRPHQMAGHGVCHIPEGRAIFPTLTVRENLLLHNRGSADDPLDRAVTAFPRLGERIQQVAGTMSGGEQQMLALARAYVTTPKYVLLDEVSMGLAPKIVEEIFTFLATLAAQGAALLVVEQFVHQILAMADLVYVMNKGQIAFAGQPTELDADALAEQYLGARTA